MEKRTASGDQATVGQVAEVVATLAQSIPRGLTREDAQRVIGQKSLLHKLVGFGLTEDLRSEGLDALLTLGSFGAEAVSEVLELAKSQLYGDEEVPSSYTYPTGWQMKVSNDQLDIIREHFPHLRPPRPKYLHTHGEVPEGADGWLIWPVPSALVPDSHQPYHDALKLVLKELVKVCALSFFHKRCGTGSDTVRMDRFYTDPYCLRLFAEAAEGQARAHQRAGGGDWCIAPFQAGFRHRQRSVRRARIRFSENEWGAGPYEVAVFLLTHPDRLTSQKHLGIDCAGAKFHQPDYPTNILYFSSWCIEVPGEVYLGNGWWGNVSGGSGSASFLG